MFFFALPGKKEHTNCNLPLQKIQDKRHAGARFGTAIPNPQLPTPNPCARSALGHLRERKIQQLPKRLGIRAIHPRPYHRAVAQQHIQCGTAADLFGGVGPITDT
jgi:hypothetical protein